MTMQAEHTSSRLGREAERHLEELLQQFDLWAASASRSEDGWEGNFPQWLDLTQEAERVMSQEHQTEAALSLLGRCWALSEEDETCADWARVHLQAAHVQELVRRLADDDDWNTRWQAYDVLGSLDVLDDGTRAALEKGTMDENAYVRRHAFLAIFGHNAEIDTQLYCRQMLSDPDSYNRYVAIRESLPGTEALWDLMKAAARDPEVALLISSDDQYEKAVLKPDK